MIILIFTTLFALFILIVGSIIKIYDIDIVIRKKLCLHTPSEVVYPEVSVETENTDILDNQVRRYGERAIEAMFDREYRDNLNRVSEREALYNTPIYQNLQVTGRFIVNNENMENRHIQNLLNEKMPTSTPANLETENMKIKQESISEEIVDRFEILDL